MDPPPASSRARNVPNNGDNENDGQQTNSRPQPWVEQFHAGREAAVARDSLQAGVLNVEGERIDGGSSSKQEDLVPHFKDQARPAGYEAAEEDSGGSIMPVAQSVHLVIEDDPAGSPTLPGTFNNRPDGAAAANFPAAMAATSDGDSLNNISSQQIALRKHMIWAGATVLIAVAVVVAVIMTSSGSISDDLPIEQTSTIESPSTLVPTRVSSASPTVSTSQPVSSTANPYSEIKLTASDGLPYDQFGNSVAINGDTIVIGAPSDDNPENGIDTGSAYVYIRSGTGWTEQAKLTASDGATNSYFGRSVAIDGDTFVVGAPYYRFAGDIGSAYVYTRSAGIWTEQAKLTASDGAANDLFGESVAIAGDTIVIVGPDDDSGNGLWSGSAYVYTFNGTTWMEQAKLTDDAEYDDQFGSSVAIDGGTIVVGACWDDTDNGSNSGSAYVYTRSGNVWTEQAKLTASDGAVDDGFGYSVAVDQDTIVIGAPNDYFENNSDSGRAYVYTRSGAVWTEQAKLTASDGAADDRFGRRVAIDQDIIVIGAYWDDTAIGEDSGSAYLYIWSGTVWTEQAKLTASDGAANDEFGFSVAIDGDTITIGAYSDDAESGEDSGSVYIFGNMQ